MRWFRFAVLVLVASILQTGPVGLIAIHSEIRPDLLLILLVFFALRSNSTDAIITSFAIGFVADLSSSALPLMGPRIISFGLFGTLLSDLNSTLYVRRVLYQALTIFVMSCSDHRPDLSLDVAPGRDRHHEPGHGLSLAAALLRAARAVSVPAGRLVDADVRKESAALSGPGVTETVMYEKRVKVLIGVSLAVLLLCVLRLGQMQLFTSPELQEEIAQATELRGPSKQFKTLRGKILDRHGEILAADMPQFEVCINYSLSCFLDERVVLAKFASAKLRGTRPSLYQVHREVDDKRQDLARIIEKCSHFGVTTEQIEAKIKEANDQVWNLRSFLCWRRGNPDSPLLAQYGNQVNHIPLSEALAELERQFPDPAERYKRIAKVQDVEEMGKCLPLVELQTEDDVFTAQMEFLEFTEGNDVQILPTGHRYYPYRSAAAQTIGWVGGATQPRDVKAFADDPLASYRKGEVCGREDGVEYVCESILRGRRGEVVYDFDRQIVRETETEFGQDVQLTLDINLQKQIEQRLTDPKVNREYGKAPMAAAILDIRSGDILALVSLPSYDLNTVRQRLRQAASRSQPSDDEPHDQPALSAGIGGQAGGPHCRPGDRHDHAGEGHRLPCGRRPHRLAQVLDLQRVPKRA